MSKKRTKSKGRDKKMSAQFLKKTLMRAFMRDAKKRLDSKQLKRKLKLNNSRDSIEDALKSLQNDGIIIFVKDGKYRFNRQSDHPLIKRNTVKKTTTGKVDMTRSGAAYILVDEGDDIYVPMRHTLNAMDGDIVQVELRSKSNQSRPEGKIVEVIKRSVSQVVGRIWMHKQYAVVHTSFRSQIPEVYVKKELLAGAKDKDYVLVTITDWSKSQNKSVWGKVKQVIEDHNPGEIAMNTILINSGFDLSFPDEVKRESEEIKEEYSQAEIERRRDFRSVQTCTIDPATAKDFDDALSLQVKDNGHIEVGVHIADVTHYLKPDSALDKEALDRSTSVYLVDRVIPMLPEKLSNNLCSLMPKVDRFTFSAVFTFDESFKIVEEWYGKGIIHSDQRFSYEEAQEYLDGKEGEFSESLLKFNEIAHALRKKRYHKGAIAFESDEVRFKLDESGKPIGVYVKERKDAHLLIEDFMLLANQKVAEYIHKKGKGQEIPFVYRVHDEPNEEKLQDFISYASEMGFKMDASTQKRFAKSILELSKKAKEDEIFKMLEPLAIRTMSKASYSTDNIGHFGLALTYYTHFTSPIRRYSDVLVHRILFENLDQTNRRNKTQLQSKCDHISAQERKAMKAERESIKFKQVEFLKDRIGEEFEGRVSGFLDRGFFVELVESKAEGLVSFGDMKEVYKLADNKLKATGKRTGHEIIMGMPIRVKLTDANLDTMQIDMEVVGMDKH